MKGYNQWQVSNFDENLAPTASESKSRGNVSFVLGESRFFFKEAASHPTPLVDFCHFLAKTLLEAQPNTP